VNAWRGLRWLMVANLGPWRETQGKGPSSRYNGKSRRAIPLSPAEELEGQDEAADHPGHDDGQVPGDSCASWPPEGCSPGARRSLP